MKLPFDPATAVPELVAPGLDGMGERLTRTTLDTLGDPESREDLIALFRAGASTTRAAAGLRVFMEESVLDRLARYIGVPDARLRVSLISSYLIGVTVNRYIVARTVGLDARGRPGEDRRAHGAGVARPIHSVAGVTHDQTGTAAGRAAIRSRPSPRTRPSRATWWPATSPVTPPGMPSARPRSGLRRPASHHRPPRRRHGQPRSGRRHPRCLPGVADRAGTRRTRGKC